MNQSIPHVANLVSPRTGREVANQFLITDGEREVFQSYRTVIAVRDYATGTTTLDTSALDYSVTTSKYLYQFLGGTRWPVTRKDVQRGIADGTYLVADLNQ